MFLTLRSSGFSLFIFHQFRKSCHIIICFILGLWFSYENFVFLNIFLNTFSLSVILSYYTSKLSVIKSLNLSVMLVIIIKAFFLSCYSPFLKTSVLFHLYLTDSPVLTYYPGTLLSHHFLVGSHCVPKFSSSVIYLHILLESASRNFLSKLP